MDLDFLYSCIIGSTWFFLAAWLLLLLAACMVAFRQDWRTSVGHGAMETVPTRTSSNAAAARLFR
jgi:hypothetical protein